MKINFKELAETSVGESTLEGRLNYKKLTGKTNHGFKEKWFKLRLNILFYFNLSETGTVVDSKPSGGYVLEQCSAMHVTLAETPFTFILKFQDEEIIFSGRTDEQIQHWVTAMNCSSYLYLRSQIRQLKVELTLLKGEEPFLAFPVNLTSEDAFTPCPLEEDRKKKQKQSFRCYLPGTHKATGEISGGTRRNGSGSAGTVLDDMQSAIFDKLADFRIGAAELTKNETAAKSVTSEVPVNGEGENTPQRNAAIPRPRPKPIRPAPNPPVPLRPPRSQKNQSVQISNNVANTHNFCDNLIEF